jgi:hypothetical protein
LITLKGASSAGGSLHTAWRLFVSARMGAKDEKDSIDIYFELFQFCYGKWQCHEE